MPKIVEIRLFSDLSPEEQRMVIANAFGRAPAWMKPFGEKIVRNGFAKPGSIAFCAFFNGRNVGFLRFQKRGSELVEGPKFAIPSRTILLKTNKTVGRLLHDAAQEFCKQSKLKYAHREAITLAERRWAARIKRTGTDVPKLRRPRKSR